MDRRWVIGALVLCACHAQLSDAPSDATDQPTDGSDATPDAAPDALVLGAWGAPQPISGASDAAIGEDDVTLSSNQLELYFAIPDTALSGNPKNLYLMTRASVSDAWSAPAAIATFNTDANEESPRLSLDDLTIYFGRGGDIYTSTRTAVGQPWSTPTPLTSVNTANYEKWFAICANGYFAVSRENGANGQDLYVGQLGVDAGALAPELSSTSSEISTFLTPDCATIYFASNRSGETHLYTATRTSPTTSFTNPTMVTDFGTSTDDEDGWMSTDQRTFVFATIRGASTTKDLYISTR